MDLNSRQHHILEQVRARGFVSIDALAAGFGVTPQTVRRDVNLLCEQGLLRRFHGGAGLPVAETDQAIEYPARRVMHPSAKRGIAAMVADHVPDGASLFINIGTTTEAVADALADHQDMRVITNSLNVASRLCDVPGFEVIITGGLVRAHDHGVVGEDTAQFIAQFKVDMGIIGISGIDADGTLLDYDPREVRVAQAIIANAREVLLVADHSKFERRPMVRVAAMSEVDVLFTDASPPSSMADVLAAAGTEVRIAAV